MINKQQAADRNSVLFINADREYKEGKNQNSLRPEDIEKITHVYRNKLDVEKYARNVPVSELEAEDYNLNIRRYVDNSPPPEPHDVRAHLNGGTPKVEIDALSQFFANYAGLREQLFQPLPVSGTALAAGKQNSTKSAASALPLTISDHYDDFADAITGKDAIKSIIENAPCTQAKHAKFHKAIGRWWSKHVSQIENLPNTGNVFELRREFLGTISTALTPQGILDVHKVRGAFADYMNTLEADFKSVAASGWGPELIPEEDILQSQFPEVLQQIEDDQARIAELEGLFAAANEVDEDEESESEETENGVLPKSQVKALKAETKALSADVREIKRTVKAMRQDAKRMESAGHPQSEINTTLAEASDSEGEGLAKQERIEQIDADLSQHNELDKELKTLKANIRQTEKKKDELVEAAREKITSEEARTLILERFDRLLHDEFDGYLRAYQRALIAAVENLHNKYAVTAKEILAERDEQAQQLNQFLVELGYE